MNEKELRTTTKQRVIIVIIAFLLLFSTIATYMAIVLSSGKSSDSDSTLTAEQQERITELQTAYTDKQTEINSRGTTLSSVYYNEFASYRSRVRSYNASSANSDGLKTEDLKTGSGKTLEEGDTDYFAYYIGWCADESVFDSSFDLWDDPKSLSVPLYAAVGLIDGWNKGVLGMKTGGIREITVPGELAYGDAREICGGTNSPLKFIVLAIEDDELKKLNNELDEIYAEILAIYYGQS